MQVGGACRQVSRHNGLEGLAQRACRVGCEMIGHMRQGAANQVLRKIRSRPVPVDPEGAAVSVIIPCYNYARYLPQAVRSVLSQEDVNVDVIVVDDASTDRSLSVARGLAADDARVRVLSHAKNQGPVDTFNDGLERARGEFLVRLDADDLLTPHSLARAVAVMRAYPSVGLVYGHPLHFSGDVLPPARAAPTGWTIWPGRQWLAARCTSGLNVITSPEVLMRRSVVDVLGGQRPLTHTHDMEMWLRMSAFCDVAYVHGADQAWHREHGDSLSARHVDAFRDLLERRDAFDTLFAGPAGTLPEAALLHGKAMQALATDAVELAIRQFDHPEPDTGYVATLREIAISLVPNPRLLHGWAGLEKRLSMGAPLAARHPVFFAERVMRGLAGRWRKNRWHRTGA